MALLASRVDSRPLIMNVVGCVFYALVEKPLAPVSLPESVRGDGYEEVSRDVLFDAFGPGRDGFRPGGEDADGLNRGSILREGESPDRQRQRKGASGSGRYQGLMPYS
jgi:hypothetical protein